MTVCGMFCSNNAFRLEDKDTNYGTDFTYKWVIELPGSSEKRRQDWRKFIIFPENGFDFLFTISCDLGIEKIPTINKICEIITDRLMHSKIWEKLNFSPNYKGQKDGTFTIHVGFKEKFQGVNYELEEGYGVLKQINVKLHYLFNGCSDVCMDSVLELAEVALASFLYDKLVNYMPAIFVEGYLRTLTKRLEYADNICKDLIAMLSSTQLSELADGKENTCTEKSILKGLNSIVTSKLEIPSGSQEMFLFDICE